MENAYQGYQNDQEYSWFYSNQTFWHLYQAWLLQVLQTKIHKKETEYMVVSTILVNQDCPLTNLAAECSNSSLFSVFHSTYQRKKNSRDFYRQIKCYSLIL